MAIESPCWPWKPSLFNQYRSKFNDQKTFLPIFILDDPLVRIASQLHLARHDEHWKEVREQLSSVDEDIQKILQRIQPIDFAQIYKVRHRSQKKTP